MSYSRSLWERIKIRIEIIVENCADTLAYYADSLKKPLILLICIGVFTTLRSGRRSIAYAKSSAYSSYGNSYDQGGRSSYNPKSWASYLGFGSSSQTAATSLSSPYGTSSQYGMTSPYGSSSMYGGGMQQSSYGSTGSISSYGSSQQYGSMASSPYGSQNNNLRGSYSTTTAGRGMPSSFKTSDLVDMHGSNVQVVQGGLFEDYGMITSFMGQIETISAMEAPSFLQQTLSSPGAGKVLVVDGGGSRNGALLDSSMAMIAQQNGWKGIILNGVVRDATSLQSSNLGIKAIGSHPIKGQQTMGQRGIPLSFGGVNFNPGHWVYADQDGIVVSQVNIGGSGSTTPGISTSGYGSTQYSTGSMSNNIYGQTGNSYSQYSQTSNNPQSVYGNTQSAYGRSGYGQNTQGIYGNSGTSSYSTTGYTSPYGGTSPYGSSKYSSTYGNTTRKKPTKKTMILLLIIVCAIMWLCMSD